MATPHYEDIEVIPLHMIWIDHNELNTKDNKETHTELGRNFGRLCVTKTEEGCMTALRNSTPSTKFVIIVSGQIGQDFVPKHKDNQKISSIYVFCGNLEKYKSLAVDYDKVRHILFTIQISYRIIFYLG